MLNDYARYSRVMNPACFSEHTYPLDARLKGQDLDINLDTAKVLMIINNVELSYYPKITVTRITYCLLG